MERKATIPPDFLALFERAPGLRAVLDLDLTFVAASDAYCRATMTVREDILGRGIFDVFPGNPDDSGRQGVEALRASLNRVIQLRQPDAMPIVKYDIQRPDAEGGGFEERHWSPVNSPIQNEDGEVVWIIIQVEDVTEIMRMHTANAAQENLMRELQREISDRKAAEERLRETTTFLDAVVENLPGGLFIKDAQTGRFVLLNRAGEDVLGFNRSEFIGKRDHDLFPKQDADQYTAADAAVLDSGLPMTIPEEPVVTKHNGTRLVRTMKVPVKDKLGRPLYLLAFSEDITERRAMEQQLRQAVKMEAVGQLTGGIAHDFNNLLAIVIGNLDIVLDRQEVADPMQTELLRDALKGALRGAELTRRLLAFSRKQALQPSIMDLNQGLPQIVSMLRRTLGEHITVDVHPGPDLWPILADPAQIDEAILNLAINARDAMPNGGILSIETLNVRLDEDDAAQNSDVSPGEFVLLALSDTGTGMDPDVLEHVFEPFFTTKEAGKGTGLGLSMVYGFVKQSDGHITLNSELGRGTVVKIFLPRAKAADAIADRTVSDERAMPSGQELVLVVEDNKDLRSVAVKQLQSLGYRTLEAGDGKQALAVLDATPQVQLLFTDIVMPGGMSGAELAREARRRFPDLKILLTSGFTARAMTNAFNDIDGLELLNKPYRKRDLALRLRLVLDRK